MKVYITKYALTQGIFEVEGEVHPTIGNGRMFCQANQGGIYHKPDWHTTREEAVARAEEMRVKKISSLYKSLAKMETLTW